jgi:hypothetical protein
MGVHSAPRPKRPLTGENDRSAAGSTGVVRRRGAGLSSIDSAGESGALSRLEDVAGLRRLSDMMGVGGAMRCRSASVFVVLAMWLLVSPCAADDLIVYTANQGFLSRIYVLDGDANVLRYFEYSYEHTFLDLEVVGDDVYALNWVDAAVYRVDLDTGALELVVADLALDLVHGVAFDGTYFYLDEWNLRRYTTAGTSAGTASFSEDVQGSAFDGRYLWTMDGSGRVSCFDLAAWPTVVPVPANDLDAPSPDCRGLWFDGEYFWTAEHVDGALGWIFVFDHSGTVVQQWLEPAFDGWAACRVRDPKPIFADGFESGGTSSWSSSTP